MVVCRALHLYSVASVARVVAIPSNVCNFHPPASTPHSPLLGLVRFYMLPASNVAVHGAREDSATTGYGFFVEWPYCELKSEMR